MTGESGPALLKGIMTSPCRAMAVLIPIPPTSWPVELPVGRVRPQQVQRSQFQNQIQVLCIKRIVSVLLIYISKKTKPWKVNTKLNFEGARPGKEESNFSLI